MCGGIPGAWERVVETIRYLSARVYVSVGLVATPDNLAEVCDTVLLADSLRVTDIRVIPAAQYGAALHLDLPPSVLVRHPILAYRAGRFAAGEPVRGIPVGGCSTCSLVLDDMAVMGGNHYPCIIYMRERGAPIGRVGPNMMQERAAWSAAHDCARDPICKANCLDVCVQYNERAAHYAERPTART
jgi:MoaA/NifB/PqqE/SkfB family radical SAM enzyme